MSDRLFLQAAFTATLAALMFASMGVTIRIASTELSNEMLVFLRSTFGLLVLFPWLCKKGLKNLATGRPAAHILRALSGLAAMYCFFYAIAHLQLATVYCAHRINLVRRKSHKINHCCHHYWLPGYLSYFKTRLWNVQLCSMGWTCLGIICCHSNGGNKKPGQY